MESMLDRLEQVVRLALANGIQLDSWERMMRLALTNGIHVG
jgi:hypothetical protein